MIVCAGKIETFPFAKEIGIGLIDSAIELSKLCLEEKPESIIFIGSAGSYGNHNIFDIVESYDASNIELSFLSKDSYTPINNRISSIEKKDNNKEIVNCSNYISTNTDLTKELNNMSISLENMEFYSVLKVAKKFNIKAYGIFVITNYISSDAHKEFIKNHKEAMKILSNDVKHREIV